MLGGAYDGVRASSVGQQGHVILFQRVVVVA